MKVKVGDIIIIKGRPCKVISVSVSKTGKHGHAKVHFKFIDGEECISAMQDIEIQS